MEPKEDLSWPKFEEALARQGLNFEKVKGTTDEKLIDKLIKECGIKSAIERTSIITEFKKRQNAALLPKDKLATCLCINNQTNYFVLEKFLATTHCGVVYKGYNFETKTEVVIKMQIIADALHQLQNEARILSLLQGCEGVPGLIGFGEDKTTGFIVLVTDAIGTDLQALRNMRKFSEDEVVAIGVKLKKILDGIHSKGVIHRDLKPENIIENEYGKLFIIDYGLACQSQESALPAMTVPFASTRQLCGAKAEFGDDYESLLYTLMYLLGKLDLSNSIMENLLTKTELDIPTSLQQFAPWIPMKCQKSEERSLRSKVR